jgi:hypothetical protein
MWLYAGGGVVLLILLLAVLRIYLRRSRSALLDVNDPPPLVIPVHRRGAAEVPFQSLYGGGLTPVDEVASYPPPPPSSPIPPLRSVFPPPASPLPPVPTSAASTTPTLQPGNGNSHPTTNGTTNGAVASRVVQEVAPSEGTLQFLPGRLEVIEGDVPGRDIRFVRTWGEIPEVTFGRVAGPPYRHVQLRSQTVSRQHARMQFIDGRWKLTNMSQTNPVVVNGQPLESSLGQRVLHEGDEIEMGDVLFRFRER